MVCEREADSRGVERWVESLCLAPCFAALCNEGGVGGQAIADVPYLRKVGSREVGGCRVHCCVVVAVVLSSLDEVRATFSLLRPTFPTFSAYLADSFICCFPLGVTLFLLGLSVAWNIRYQTTWGGSS